MNKDNLIKILIPVVAVVVLIESLVLIINIGKRQNITKTRLPVETIAPEEEVASEEEKKVAFEVVLVSPDLSYKLGKTTSMEVKANVLADRSIDSANLYLKYNPAAFDISNLTFDERLPKPTFSKVSTSKGMVVVNFLITDPAGLALKSGESLTLAKFDLKAKLTGNFDFEVSTGNEAKESATMFVENNSSKILPFTSNKLTINVLR